MNLLRDALLKGRRRPRYSGAGSPLHYRGDGYEFVELREYVQGDDVRRIDWAASARSAQLQTRVLLEDVALTLGVWIDESASMQAGRMRPLRESALEAQDLWLFAASGTDRVRRLQTLEEAAALPRGAAFLAVSDWFEMPDELAQYLGARLDCTALIARDPWQSGLPLSGFVRVRDAETGEAVTLFVGEAERIRYCAASRDREAGLMQTFERANWRTGVLEEEDGSASLLRAFGLA